MRAIEETIMKAVELEATDPLEKIVNMYYSESETDEYTTEKFIEAMRQYVSVYGTDLQPLKAALKQINIEYYAIIVNRIVAGLSDEKIIALYETEMNLLELMFTEHVNISELIEALRQYVSVNGVDLQPIAVNIVEISRQSAETNCDYTFGWINKEADSNSKSTTTLTVHPRVENCYIVTSEVFGSKFSREIDLPEQIVAELLRNTASDGSKIELGKPFDSKIIVQLYNDYREAIIDAYTLGTVNAMIGFYAIPANMIAAGVGNEEISAYFEADRAVGEARKQAEFEATMANYSETEKAEYEKFYAVATPSLKA